MDVVGHVHAFNDTVASKLLVLAIRLVARLDCNDADQANNDSGRSPIENWFVIRQSQGNKTRYGISSIDGSETDYETGDKNLWNRGVDHSTVRSYLVCLFGCFTAHQHI
jgi:hypothetical protein